MMLVKSPEDNPMMMSHRLRAVGVIIVLAGGISTRLRAADAPATGTHGEIARQPMLDVPLRLASEEDLNAVTQLLYDCIAEMRRTGIEQWDEVYPNREVLLADIRDSAMYVAEDERRLVATLVLNEFQNEEWAGARWTVTGVPVLVVHRVMVDPRDQGNGIARALMQYAEQWARTHGYGAIRLDAFSANPRALRLYHRLGYRDAGLVMLRKGLFHCFEKRVNPENRSILDHPSSTEERP